MSIPEEHDSLKPVKRAGAVATLKSAMEVAGEDDAIVAEIQGLLDERKTLDKTTRARTETMITTMLTGVPAYHLQEALATVTKQFNEVDDVDFSSKPNQLRRAAERQRVLKLFKQLDKEAHRLPRTGHQSLLLVNENVAPFVVVSVVQQSKAPASNRFRHGRWTSKHPQFEIVMAPTTLHPHDHVLLTDIAFDSIVYIITHTPCAAKSVGTQDYLYSNVHNLPPGSFFAIEPLKQYGQQLFPTVPPFRLHPVDDCEDSEDEDTDARKVTYIAGHPHHYAGISTAFPNRMMSDKRRRQLIASA